MINSGKNLLCGKCIEYNKTKKEFYQKLQTCEHQVMTLYFPQERQQDEFNVIEENSQMNDESLSDSLDFFEKIERESRKSINKRNSVKVRQVSMELVEEVKNGATEFGLVNDQKQFNCFLNVTIQSLWHLQSFRDAFKNLKEKEQRNQTLSQNTDRRSELNFIKALLSLVDQIPTPKIQPEKLLLSCNQALRRELYKLTYLSGTFDLYQKGDPQEALITILKVLHAFSIDEFQRKTKGECNIFEQSIEGLICNKSSCISHSLCQLNLKEEFKCEWCNDVLKNGKFDDNNFMHLIYIDEYMNIANNMLKDEQTMAKILQKMRDNTFYQTRCMKPKCQQYTRNKIRVFTEILQPLPEVLNLGLNWNTSKESKALQIINFFQTLTGNLNMKDLFITKQPDFCYNLHSIVCFVGKHYLVFILKGDTWTLFNDAVIKRYFTWNQLVDYCLDTKSLPTLLTFERVENPSQRLKLEIGRYDEPRLLMKAKEQDQLLEGMECDEGFINQQMEMLEKINVQRRQSVKAEDKQDKAGSMEVDISWREDAKKEEEKKEPLAISNSDMAMKDLKMKFFEKDIYLYMCPQCDQQTLLCLQKCHICDAPNDFLDDTQTFSQGLIDACLEELSNVVFGIVPVANDSIASQKDQPVEKQQVQQEIKQILKNDEEQPNKRQKISEESKFSQEKPKKQEQQQIPFTNHAKEQEEFYQEQWNPVLSQSNRSLNKIMSQQEPPKHKKVFENQKPKVQVVTMWRCPKCLEKQHLDQKCKCQPPCSLEQFQRGDLSKYLFEEEIEIPNDQDSSKPKIEKSKSVPQPHQNTIQNQSEPIQPKKEEEHWECEKCKFPYNVVNYNDFKSAQCVGCDVTNDKLLKKIQGKEGGSDASTENQRRLEKCNVCKQQQAYDLDRHFCIKCGFNEKKDCYSCRKKLWSKNARKCFNEECPSNFQIKDDQNRGCIKCNNCNEVKFNKVTYSCQNPYCSKYKQTTIQSQKPFNSQNNNNQHGTAYNAARKIEYRPVEKK